MQLNMKAKPTRGLSPSCQVIVDGTISDKAPVISGLPKETVLCPLLLFLLSIHYLPQGRSVLEIQWTQLGDVVNAFKKKSLYKWSFYK